MSNVNSVVVSGNLTRDIELRRTPNDFVIGNAAVAVERSKKVDDEWVKETSFFDVTLFGGSAEFAARKLRKGDLVTISGRLEQQTWETQEGQKRSKVIIVATSVDSHGFFRSKDEDNDLTYETAGGGSTQAAKPAPADDDIPF